ncbi:MAG: nucleotidyltransferase family protein [Candidatus Heimdallarchaeota archaeon]|nr:nucleotidyltransferase family protein [Candidatus Heimdallarchaeota archaeon]
MIEEAIILAGGVGSRLQGTTMNQFPKALAQVQNKPIIYWIMKWLAKNGVEKMILATGHLAEKIEEEFGNEVEFYGKKIKLVYSKEIEKLGSGGAVRLASRFVETDDCFIINGDILCDIPLKPMIDLHLRLSTEATMLLVNLKSRFGVVESKNNLITKFVEKPTLPLYIHSGIDIVRSQILSRFPERGQMEETIFVDLAEAGKFGAYHAPEGYYWDAIDTPKELKNANNEWKGIE